jgi:hypothetical protein
MNKIDNEIELNVMEQVTTFSREVSALCSEKSMDCIDAVVHWCEINNHEVEYAADLIKHCPIILFDIQVEAENLNILKKNARLPI